jgi:predicted GIY-YIG superfamily endonuclease
MVWIVYEIRFSGEVRYIGITNDLKRRQRQHRFESKREDLKKFLYKMKAEHHQEEDIVLKEVFMTEKKIEAIRMEAHLILKDWFDKRKLWQSAPHIVKYF